LLAEAREGDISTALKEDLAVTLGLKGKGDAQTVISELVTSAQALPETLEGPRRVRFSQALRDDIRAGDATGPIAGTQSAASQSPGDKPDVGTIKPNEARGRRASAAQATPVVTTSRAGDEPKRPAAAATTAGGPLAGIIQPGNNKSPQSRPRFRADGAESSLAADNLPPAQPAQTGRVITMPPSDQPAAGAAQPKRSRFETGDDQPTQSDQSPKGRETDA
jgi:hypothetical protein